MECRENQGYELQILSQQHFKQKYICYSLLGTGTEEPVPSHNSWSTLQIHVYFCIFWRPVCLTVGFKSISRHKSYFWFTAHPSCTRILRRATEKGHHFLHESLINRGGGGRAHMNKTISGMVWNRSLKVVTCQSGRNVSLSGGLSLLIHQKKVPIGKVWKGEADADGTNLLSLTFKVDQSDSLNASWNRYGNS